MKPGARKSGSGRAKRVATIFTGAAACATVVTPAATAATAGAAQPGRSAARIRPELEQGYCPNTPKWVHLASRNTHTLCFGYDGQSIFSSNNPINFDVVVSKVCGGNNSGWIQSWNGKFTFFGPGDTSVHLPWPGTTRLASLDITNSQPKGNHAC
jgi:hypothetical protein